MSITALIASASIIMIQSRTAPGPEASPGLHSDGTMVVDAITREFAYHVPPAGVAGAVLPIVIYLHGHGDTIQHMTGEGALNAASAVLRTVADAQRFVVMYPLGTIGSSGQEGWNDCKTDSAGNPTVDDVEFIGALIEWARVHLNGDTHRVYLLGFSNGGHMAMRVALEIPTQIAAIGMVSALNGAELTASCVAGIPPNPTVPIMIMHGDIDPISPFGGGEIDSGRGTVYSFADSVDQWKTWNGVADVTPTSGTFPDINAGDAGATVSWQKWTAVDAGDASVYALTVNQGGHVMPSIAEHEVEAVVGNQCWDIEGAEEWYNYVKGFSR